MNELEIRQAFEKEGYTVLKIKQWRPNDPLYVTIRERNKLIEASEFGQKLGVIVTTPC